MTFVQVSTKWKKPFNNIHKWIFSLILSCLLFLLIHLIIGIIKPINIFIEFLPLGFLGLMVTVVSLRFFYLYVK